MQIKKAFHEKPILIRDALARAVSVLKGGGVAQPRLEGELLLASLLAIDRVKLIMNDQNLLSKSSWEQYQNRLQQRVRGWPLQYLIGRQEFMSLDLLVTPSVLIPRGDTEILAEEVLALKEKAKKAPTIIDVGTGSGAIAVALAYYWREAKIYATDVSPEALEIAKKNADRHRVKIEFILGDLLTPFIKNSRKFDIIVSNPPYIASGEIKLLPKDVQKEPKLALDGGREGLDYYQKLIPQAMTLLERQGTLALEIGWDQGLAVKQMLEHNGFKQIAIIQDYGSRDRVVIGHKE